MAVESSQRTTTQGSPLRSMVSVLVGNKEPPLPPQPAMGFFTDTSLCIGCKACEVACKQWNQLPAQDAIWTGSSYDNTGQLTAITWRHVQFIEQIGKSDGHDRYNALRSDIDDRIAQARSEGTIPATPPGTA